MGLHNWANPDFNSPALCANIQTSEIHAISSVWNRYIHNMLVHHGDAGVLFSMSPSSTYLE